MPLQNLADLITRIFQLCNISMYNASWNLDLDPILAHCIPSIIPFSPIVRHMTKHMLYTAAITAKNGAFAYCFFLVAGKTNSFLQKLGKQREYSCIDDNFEYYKDSKSYCDKFENEIMKCLMDESLMGWSSRSYKDIKSAIFNAETKASKNSSHNDDNDYVDINYENSRNENAEIPTNKHKPDVASKSDDDNNFRENVSWLLTTQMKDLVDFFFVEIDSMNNENEQLDEHDFEHLGLIHVWERIRENQDTDNNYKISLKEFRVFYLQLSLRSRLSSDAIEACLHREYKKTLLDSISVLELLTLAHHYLYKNLKELCTDFKDKISEDIDPPTPNSSSNYNNNNDDNNNSNNNSAKTPRASRRSELTQIFNEKLNEINENKNEYLEPKVIKGLCDINTDEKEKVGLSKYRSTNLSWLLPFEMLRAMDEIYDILLESSTDLLQSLTTNKLFPRAADAGNKVTRQQFKEFIIGTALRIPVCNYLEESPILMLNIAKAFFQEKILDQLKLIRDKRKLFISFVTQLTIVGTTDPDAMLMLDGKEVLLAPDGSFKVKMQIPIEQRCLQIKTALLASKGGEREPVQLRFDQDFDGENAASPRPRKIYSKKDKDEDKVNDYFIDDDGNDNDNNRIEFLLGEDIRGKIDQVITRIVEWSGEENKVEAGVEEGEEGEGEESEVQRCDT